MLVSKIIFFHLNITIVDVIIVVFPLRLHDAVRVGNEGTLQRHCGFMWILYGFIVTLEPLTLEIFNFHVVK